MPEVSFVNLFAVALIALLSPLLLGLVPGLRIPAIVVEIVAGAVLGPAGLGLIRVDLPVRVMSLIGLAFLLFLAGLEIDVHSLRGRRLVLALGGYGISLVLAVLGGLSFYWLDWVRSPLLLAVLLSATSLGLVVPILEDAGQIEGELGQNTVAAASVADFGAVVLLSLLFSTSGGSTGGRIVLLFAFAVLVAVTAGAVLLADRWMRLRREVRRLQDTTAEIRVRAAVVLLMAFAALAERFGLETILGAFMAGAVVGLVDRDTSTHPRFRAKLEGIGYGFVVPVFFVVSGLRLDLRGLFHEPSALLRVPLFLLALLIVRGVPALLYKRSFGRRASLAVGLLQATSLPFIVAASQIGVVIGLMTRVTAAALICAGLLSVLLFPTSALALLRDRARPPAEPPP
ncbi:cation:proton antiporter [Actinomadura scrupuli]|uniref:cation:proton antiporter n=1 Tax=Actinomadura scrupuli TaxID=559629 RepID=UPI003D98D0D3